ncbi:MAG: class I SAM-dependent DNA methyltransferase [Chloroflexota bacterium]
MAKQQTNETLRNDMWRACDILRRDNNVGGVMQYTEHIAWLLFLKFLDEEEKERAAQALLGGDPYTPVLQGELAWASWASAKKLKATAADELIRYVRGRLLPGLAALNGSPLARTIAGIFSDENVGDQTVLRSVPVCASGYNLKDVLEIINNIRFDSDEDIFTITRFYEDLLERMGNENRMAGEFHTPRPVIRFMVELIDPQIGETIYDPASGSCGFLAQAYEYMVTNQPRQTIADRAFLQQEAFVGQEKKALSALLGTMNMVLHGVAAPNIKRGNTLEEDVTTSVADRFDIILTNPPFGGTEGRHIQQNFPVKANATELLFLQHIIKKLKRSPNGRCAMVVPEGTLFRGGAFATVKQDLLEQFHLFAVVSLPPGTFAPYSDVKTALLFFQRPDGVLSNNPLARQETWYYEMALPNGLKKFSKGNPIQHDHFDEARAMWCQWHAYLQGKGECPFSQATDVRDQWQVHWAWEAYRHDEKGKVDKPAVQPDDSPAAKAAHSAEGRRPAEPYTSWLETLDELKARGTDLSARNPNQDDRVRLPHPAEITASLLERTREFQSILLGLHELITNGNDESD